MPPTRRSLGFAFCMWATMVAVFCLVEHFTGRPWFDPGVIVAMSVVMVIFAWQPRWFDIFHRSKGN